MKLFFCGDSSWKNANVQSFNDDISIRNTSIVTTVERMFFEVVPLMELLVDGTQQGTYKNIPRDIVNF